ncbi:MAG: hypothetical protein RL215_2856 [Planctomycetota bacterium]|jgi:hypothetical protein
MTNPTPVQSLTVSQIPPDARSADTDIAWEAVLFALGELPPRQHARFEERLATDPELCEHLVEATRVVECLRRCHFPAHPELTRPQTSPASRSRRYASVTAAIAALVGVAVAMNSLPRSNPDSIRDAVALTSLLQQSETVPEISPETDPDIEPSLSSLETPAWLLTAIDLDEQAPIPDDQDQGVY